MFPDSPAPEMAGPILVIDDEPYILRSLSYLLTPRGIHRRDRYQW